MKTTTRIHASPVSDKNGQRPDTPAGFPARLASRWLDGLIAERGLSRNTVAAYRQDLDALRDFLDELETPLSGLDDENITLFIAWLRKRGDATRTLARRISSLRSFLAWCVERGELASNPAALIDTPKLPSLLPDVLTQDEIVRLLRCIRSLLFGVGLMLFALGILAFGLMFTQGTPIFGVIFYGSALLFLLGAIWWFCSHRPSDPVDDPPEPL